jgi:hypothetical protein
MCTDVVDHTVRKAGICGTAFVDTEGAVVFGEGVSAYAAMRVHNAAQVLVHTQ